MSDWDIQITFEKKNAESMSPQKRRLMLKRISGEQKSAYLTLEIYPEYRPRHPKRYLGTWQFSIDDLQDESEVFLTVGPDGAGIELGGAALSMQALTGMYQGVYLVLAAGFFLLYFVPISGVLRRGTFWAAAAVALVVFILSNGPILALYMKVHRTFGLNRAYYQVAGGGISLSRYLYVHPTNRVLPLLGVPTPADRPQYVGWPGAVMLLGALTALVLMWRRSARRFRKAALFYLAAALVFWVLTLGPVVRLTPEKPLGPGPYRFLVKTFPQFKKLRYPKRMMVMTSLFLTVLAGLGVGEAARRLRRRSTRAAFVAAASLLVLVEYCSVPLPLLKVYPDEDTLQFTRWLGRRKDRPVVAHFPADYEIEVPSAKFKYHIFLSAFHWQRVLLNGPGTWPPVYNIVRRWLARFPAPRAIDFLQAVGVTDVVLHHPELPNWPFDPERVGDDRLFHPKRFGKVTVYRLKPCRADWRRALRRPGTLLVPRSVPAGVVVKLGIHFRDRDAMSLFAAPLDRLRVKWVGPSGEQGGPLLSRMRAIRLVDKSGPYLHLDVVAPGKAGASEFRLVEEGAGTAGPILRLPVEVVESAEGYWADREGPPPRAEVRLLGPPPGPLPAGGELRLAVRLTNTGTSTWGCRTGKKPGRPKFPVRLGWFLKEGAKKLASGRSFLPCDLGPGQSVELPVRVELPSRAGTYLLTIDPILEHVGWFGEWGSEPVRLRLLVGEGG